jgi:hypothetical protein
MPSQDKTAPGLAPTESTEVKPPVVLEEPRAGGNYLRDPVTGELSLNPEHPTSEE